MEEFHQGHDDKKETLLLLVSDIFKWIAVLSVSGIIISLSAFSYLNLWISVLITLVLLTSVYLFGLHKEYEFLNLEVDLIGSPNLNSSIDSREENIQHRSAMVKNPTEISFNSLSKILRFYISTNPFKFFISMGLIILYSFWAPLLSSNLCIGFYDQAEGFKMGPTYISSYFTRLFGEVPCSSGICHTYLTLPSDPTTEAIINFHVSSSVCESPLVCSPVIEIWNEQSGRQYILAQSVPYSAPES